MATNQDLAKFVVWAPDAGADERRLAVRPRHLENVHQLAKEGIVRKPITWRSDVHEHARPDGDVMEHTQVSAEPF